MEIIYPKLLSKFKSAKSNNLNIQKSCREDLDNMSGSSIWIILILLKSHNKIHKEAIDP